MAVGSVLMTVAIGAGYWLRIHSIAYYVVVQVSPFTYVHVLYSSVPSFDLSCNCIHLLYAYSIKEPIGELNLKRALDEDTRVFLPSFPFFHLLLHWVRQPFLGIPPFISDPGSLCLFLYLDLL